MPGLPAKYQDSGRQEKFDWSRTMRTSDLTINHISKLKTTRSELFANYRNNDAFNEDEGDAAEVNCHPTPMMHVPQLD